MRLVDVLAAIDFFSDGLRMPNFIPVSLCSLERLRGKRRLERRVPGSDAQF
jgi:hypothetical protein